METLTESVLVRLTPEQKKAAETVAANKGMKLATYLRFVLNQAVRKEGKPKEPK